MNLAFPSSTKPREADRFASVRLGSGIALFWGGPCRKDGALPLPGENALIFLTVLSGEVRLHRKGERKNAAPALPHGDLVLACEDCGDGMRISAGPSARYAGVAAPPAVFERIAMENSALFPLPASVRGAQVREAGPAHPESRGIVEQLLSRPLNGWSGQLFVEAKCLELLALRLDLLGRRHSGETGFLNGPDVQRLHEARRILGENIVSPPGIQGLSRLCGMNECKLKKGFREFFGHTIYEYLRKERMHRARALLRDPGTSVGIVASLVGYSNTSHFIAAFRREFGVTPGAFLRQR